MNNRMDATVALASEQTIVEISDADVEEYVFAVKLVIYRSKNWGPVGPSFCPTH